MKLVLATNSVVISANFLNLFQILNIISLTDCFKNSVPLVFIGVTVVFEVDKLMLEPSSCFLRLHDIRVIGSSIICFQTLVFLYEVYENEVIFLQSVLCQQLAFFLSSLVNKIFVITLFSFHPFHLFYQYVKHFSFDVFGDEILFGLRIKMNGSKKNWQSYKLFSSRIISVLFVSVQVIRNIFNTSYSKNFAHRIKFFLTSDFMQLQVINQDKNLKRIEIAVFTSNLTGFFDNCWHHINLKTYQ